MMDVFDEIELHKDALTPAEEAVCRIVQEHPEQYSDARATSLHGATASPRALSPASARSSALPATESSGWSSTRH